MSTIFETKLLSLLPSGLIQYDEVCWLCEAMQPEIDEIADIIQNKIIFTQLDTLDDLTLDYLLVERRIANSIETIFINNRQDKINFIKNYVQLKKLKGTKAGVEYVLNLLGFNAAILEWFEYGGEPYTFQISITGSESLTPERLKLLNALIDQYKNTRSWAYYAQNISLESTTYIGIATTVSLIICDVYVPPKDIVAQSCAYAAIATCLAIAIKDNYINY